ncbi:DUF2786 domain-containing protein [Hydrogenophaga aromaticivorans]|uniref:DUF2786 domain-containing protein n=1 Tax=Hydrogenophaga aromaticivorans TaxID=2610898 RepID=UPI001B360DD2|nr:DUF2786 domain-containing protein [Hydrogenophaga aromaticivorans]MBQ0916849.1 DUF2786 domain-containing protein [Hydrogenophaga aromaticivorans]
MTSDAIPDRAKLLRRLRKILALAESANPGEAAAALHQARALMDKYGIDEVDAQTSAFEESSATKLAGADVLPWEGALLSIIENSLGVKALIGGFNRRKGARRLNAQVIFVGEGPRAELAEYAFKVLRRKLKTAIDDAVHELVLRVYPEAVKGECRGVLKPAQRKAYAMGWCCAVRGKIQALHTPPPSEALKRYLLQRGVKDPDASPPPKPKKRSGKRDPVGAYLSLMGVRDGRDVALHKAMSEQAGQARLGLDVH